MHLFVVFSFAIFPWAAGAEGPLTPEEWRSFDRPPSNEIAPSEQKRYVPRSPDLVYVNPRSTEATCGIPLSIDEKIRQQDLKNFGKFMASQGVSGSKSTLASWIAHELIVAKRHPWIIGNWRRIAKLSDDTHSAEKKLFPKGQFSRIDDEADAFRHFYLTARLLTEFGVKRTKQLLEGHELFDRNLGSMMDLYNNAQSIAILKPHLEALRKMTPQERDQFLETQFISNLHNGSFVVISPKFESTPKPNKSFYVWAHDRLRRPLPQ